MPEPQELAAAVASITERALNLIQEPDGRVRVEDYLTALAAATGEASLVDSGLFDIEHTELIPGQGVFGDAINRVLSDDRTSVELAGRLTVVGVLRDELVPEVVPLAAFGSIERLYQHVAEHAANPPWGSIAVTVSEDHLPRVLPIRSAFEMRAVVESESERLGLRVTPIGPNRQVDPGRHSLCAAALAAAITQTAGAMDPSVALTLALEVTFGMAKMVPMSKVAFERVRQNSR